MRARMALATASAEYEHREVLLRDKPDHMLEVSPKGSVPVLLVNNSVIDESLDIMRWALPEASIDPAIIEMIDGPFKFHLDRYKYASRYDPTAKRGDVNLAHRVLAIESLTLIEKELEASKYLSGGTLGPTDMASFPFVRQFAAVENDWWKTEAPLPLTRAWLDACVSSDLFKKIMAKFPVWVPLN